MARYGYRYLVSKPGLQGSTRWYWQPKKGLRAFGWEPQRLRPDLTFPELCAITGHSEKSALSVLKHYLALNGDMADNAIQKLIDWEEAQATDQVATDES